MAKGVEGLLRRDWEKGSVPRFIAFLRKKPFKRIGLTHSYILQNICYFLIGSGLKIVASHRGGGDSGGFAAGVGRLGDPSLPIGFERRYRAKYPQFSTVVTN